MEMISPIALSPYKSVVNSSMYEDASDDLRTTWKIGTLGTKSHSKANTKKFVSSISSLMCSAVGKGKGH